MRGPLILLIAAAALAGVGSTRAEGPASRRVILLSFDGVADWIVDRLIEEGKAPALAAMAGEGARADAMISVIPTLTAAAHGTLWTGAYPRDHGAMDNSMPRTPAAAHTLLESQSGFLSGVLNAEPIWITAARHGKQVLVAQATGGYPFLGAFPERLTQFDAYGERLLRSELIEARLGARPHAFRIGETEAHVRRDGAARLVLRVGEAEAVLMRGARQGSPPMAVRVDGRAGHVRVLLLDLEPAGGRVLLVRGEVRLVSSTHPPLIEPLIEEAGVPLGEVPAVGPYRRGRFGPSLAEGGRGDAERMLADAVLANHAYFTGAARFASSRPWDLLVLYVPSMDTAGHALVGMLDPDTPGHDPALAARVWPLYERLFRLTVDDYVADLRRRFPDASLVMAADHGMEGTRRVWYPNAVLREAGLLAEQGTRVDLSRTKALFLYSDSGGIYVNADRHRGGIVGAADRDAVKKAVTTALLSARDPADGTPLARAVIDAELDGEALGVGGDLAADLYFDPTPGYEAHAAFGAPHIVAEGPPMGAGAHGPFPTRRRLHAVFFAAGPGIAPRTRPGIVRAVDVAPTVSQLLGIPAPPQSVGRALPVSTETVGR